MSDYQWDLFLSHSSKDKEAVEQWATRLRDAGLKVWLDKWELKGGDRIAGTIEEGLEGSERLMVFLSPDSMGSQWVEVETDVSLFQKRSVKRPIIPVLLSECKIRPLLTPIKHIDLRELDALRRLLAAVQSSGPVSSSAPAVAAPNLDLSHLPNTGGQLFGRDAMLEALDRVWQGHKWRIGVLVAEGGVGKTGLVVEWLNRISHNGYAGADWLFGWSFYSQGSREDRQVSSDAFFTACFKFLGVTTTYTDPHERGQALAALVQAKRGLLLLDGLEPLQYPPGVQLGRIRDPAMAAFLNKLAWQNNGLCLITTRVQVQDLVDKTAGVWQIALDHLSVQAGAELLASYDGLTGSRAELEQAAGEYGGHALALNLLGSYLVAVHGGDICRRDRIKALSKARSGGEHAKKVMASYELWLQEKPELALLYLLGLFDRPAGAAELQAVLAAPAIEGLTERLPDLDGEEWRYALTDLRTLRLLAPGGPESPLDCHPLVREYFGAQLQKKYPRAWREAHRRLFDHFCALPTQDQPDTLDELLPLYRAIPHGCQAGLHQQALHKVYLRRIRRGNEDYATKKLGAYGVELGAVASFFAQPWSHPWSHPAAELSAADCAFALNVAAFQLRATGRLRESLQVQVAGLKMDIQQEGWRNAAIAASNLGQSSLVGADLPEAIAYARLAVALADVSGDAFWQMANRALQAALQHQLGALEPAGTLFRAAEAMQCQQQPDYPLLYSLRGYWYNALLLTQQQHAEVQQRAEKTLQWMKEGKFLLNIALDQLTLGQACIGLGRWDEAERWLQQAVADLRRAGAQDHLPRGLIARAGYYRLRQRWEPARQDLAEAGEISQRGEMHYFAPHILLEQSQLAQAQGQSGLATEFLEQAEARIQQTALFVFAPLADQLRRQLGGTARVWEREGVQRQIEAKTKQMFKKYPLPSR
ncbi:MAG: TIR domain-containing protein [Magnetococcales bacterium]|nr:TIR domain-containing protein [Magnetococcales bacterium]